MSKGVVTVDVEPVGVAAQPDPRAAPGGARFDWLVAGLGVWFVGGLYLDGWAHIHISALESFFTPWHAVLYSGYLAHATVLVLTFWRHRRRGARRSTALPDGYRASLVGVFIFFFAGVADMLWHVAFGIETGVEGLISPSHLGLAVGGGLMVTGPLRSALRRPGWEEEAWLARMPLVVSLTLLVSVLTFFTEYASPYGGTWVTNAAARGTDGIAYVYQSVGLAGFLVQPVILMGPILHVLRSQSLPAGSLTILLTVNVALMAIVHDKYLITGPLPLVGAAFLAGAIGDLLLRALRPSPRRIRAFRTVAFAIPAAQYLLYFVVVGSAMRLAWSVHLWTGAVMIAGGVGWLTSYLVVPARLAGEPPMAARSSR